MADKAKDRLLREGRDYAYGARPLRRAIQKMVEDPVSEMVLRREIKAGDTVVAEADADEKLIFSKKG